MHFINQLIAEGQTHFPIFEGAQGVPERLVPSLSDQELQGKGGLRTFRGSSEALDAEEDTGMCSLKIYVVVVNSLNRFRFFTLITLLHRYQILKMTEEKTRIVSNTFLVKTDSLSLFLLLKFYFTLIYHSSL